MNSEYKIKKENDNKIQIENSNQQTQLEQFIRDIEDDKIQQIRKEIENRDLLPKLQNIVSTVNFGCPLDLKTIALKCRNAEYNPKRFAAVIMRLRDPKTTALIFASGKMVCTGAKTEEASNRAARKYAKIIQLLKFPVQFKVASTDVKFPINLDELEQKNKSWVQYEPEIFPGLIYRHYYTVEEQQKKKREQIVLLIFVSGKIVLTGAKTREKIIEAFIKIYPLLKEFAKEDFKEQMNDNQKIKKQILYQNDSKKFIDENQTQLTLQNNNMN